MNATTGATGGPYATGGSPKGIAAVGNSLFVTTATGVATLNAAAPAATTQIAPLAAPTGSPSGPTGTSVSPATAA